MFEKWQQFRGAAIFPEEDLPAVLREFQRAHSHARGHWVRYDMRIREYIRQRVDASVWEQIQQWEGNIVEDNVENVQQDDSSNNPLNSVMEDDEEWALPGISQPPTAAIQAPAVHPWITGPVAETATTTTSQEQSHDWKYGARIGEAQIPGPFLSLSFVVVMVNSG